MGLAVGAQGLYVSDVRIDWQKPGEDWEGVRQVQRLVLQRERA